MWYNHLMSYSTDLLDRVLDPVGRALSADAANRILALRADPQVQERIDFLANGCNEGILTADEKSEYEALVNAINLIDVLQIKARLALSSGDVS